MNITVVLSHWVLICSIILTIANSFTVEKAFNDVEAETPILWPPDVESWFIWKDPDSGKDCEQEEKGMTEDERVGWHHRHSGHGFGWIPAVGVGQGGLACCGSWGRKELDTTEQLNWTECPKRGIFSYITIITILHWKSKINRVIFSGIFHIQNSTVVQKCLCSYVFFPFGRRAFPSLLVFSIHSAFLPVFLSLPLKGAFTLLSPTFLFIPPHGIWCRQILEWPWNPMEHFQYLFCLTSGNTWPSCTLPS